MFGFDPFEVIHRSLGLALNIKSYQINKGDGKGWSVCQLNIFSVFFCRKIELLGGVNIGFPGPCLRPENGPKKETRASLLRRKTGPFSGPESYLKWRQFLCRVLIFASLSNPIPKPCQHLQEITLRKPKKSEAKTDIIQLLNDAEAFDLLARSNKNVCMAPVAFHYKQKR